MSKGSPNSKNTHPTLISKNSWGNSQTLTWIWTKFHQFTPQNQLLLPLHLWFYNQNPGQQKRHPQNPNHPTLNHNHDGLLRISESGFWFGLEANWAGEKTASLFANTREEWSTSQVVRIESGEAVWKFPYICSYKFGEKKTGRRKCVVNHPWFCCLMFSPVFNLFQYLLFIYM